MLIVTCIMFTDAYETGFGGFVTEKEEVHGQTKKPLRAPLGEKRHETNFVFI